MAANLPERFLQRMQEMLGEDDYERFLKSYDSPREYGLRVNTSKISCEEFERIAPFPVRRIPWVENGYFYMEESRPGKHPYYQAGLYYLQEPSAMTPASRLPIEPGDYVLDMCAAPGGKATAAGAALEGQGLLVANDISGPRCKALLRNLELFGITNGFLTNEAPAKLAPEFPEFFHKILLDAPCSGEGMFRKEDAMAADWTPEKSEEIAKIQRELILTAVKMLRPGGKLLYSTCTFAPIEDEGTVSWLLEQCPEMELLDMEGYEGFSRGCPDWGNGDPALAKTVRIFPHRMNGEGHFLALLGKKNSGTLADPDAPAENPISMAECLPTVDRAADRSASRERKKKKGAPAPSAALPKEARSVLAEFFAQTGISSIGTSSVQSSRFELHGEKLYLLPPVEHPAKGIVFLRDGLFLGDLKKNRFEPSEPFALALRKGQCAAAVDLAPEDSRIGKYLRGETLSLEEGEATVHKGWVLVTVNGYPLGWGKLVNGTLKNKYPAGWRLM